MLKYMTLDEQLGFINGLKDGDLVEYLTDDDDENWTICHKDSHVFDFLHNEYRISTLQFPLPSKG